MSAEQQAPTRVLVDPEALASEPEPGGLVREFLEQWTEVYDWTYRDGPGDDPALDVSGWRATGTGEPIGTATMAEWADRTAELILRHAPRHVLELGCGTGMLLHRLAPHVETYVGTDLAADAVARHHAVAPHVAVVRAAAHEVAGPTVAAALDGVEPDCVVINSVTQCFPDVAHLATVLRGAVGLVAAGGTVVVGDVRHAGLLYRHALDLERAADPGAGDADLDDRATRRTADDRELCLDPATVATAALTGGRAVTLTCHAKTLTAGTELARYRVDLVLHVDAAPPGEPARHDLVPDALLHPGAPDAATAAELAGPDRVVGRDLADPSVLTVTAPTGSARIDAADLAGRGRPHEPLAAFAGRRVRATARREARQAGRSPGPVEAVLPSGADPDTAAEAHAVGLAALDARTRASALDGDVVPAAVETLDLLATRTMDRTLARLGVWHGGRLEEPALPTETAVAARHAWILRGWPDALVAHGLAVRDGEHLVRATEPPRPERSLGEACAALGYPPAMAAFFRAAAEHLPALLRDEVDLQSLLFADGDVLTALAGYQDNTVNSYLNAALGRVAVRAATTRKAPLRVLEVGAGVGASTAAVLDALDGAGQAVDLVFTDVSRFFTDAARERFGDRTDLRYGLLDIEELSDHQERHDLIVAANVVHNAVDVRGTLRGLRGLLAPGGVLALVESTREHLQAAVSMQFLMSPRAGRAAAGSRDRRAGTDRIFLSAGAWRGELAAAGLWPAGTLPSEDLPLSVAGQHLLLARRV